MGIFRSSWKYSAYAASSPLFEEEKEHPHTFQKVMLEGLSADDSFSNILRYTLATDLYARSKAMVRYATREVDPYVRGLPTSDLATMHVEKAWIESATLREIKMPLLDFYWMMHGLFDAQYVGCKFIHDHYMDIDYFPWPGGCLPDIKNPNFDDGLEHWIPTDFQANTTERVAELTASGGTLFSDQVGEVTPGDVISLRAVCSRGDESQTGHINITFYNSSGTEVSTVTATNSVTPADDWELLTIITTVPAGATTAKAWAGGTMGGQRYIAASCGARITGNPPYTDPAFIDFYASGGNYPDGTQTGKDFVYDTGTSYDWHLVGNWTDTENTDYDQYYIKVTLDTVHSGSGADSTAWYRKDYGVDFDTWLDIWDWYEFYIEHRSPNGLMQHVDVTFSIAESNGAGGPDLTKVKDFPFTMMTYFGVHEALIQEYFATNGGDLAYRTIDYDYRLNGFADASEPWVDEYYELTQDYDYGAIYCSTGGGYAINYEGWLYADALYTTDATGPNVRVESEVCWDHDTFNTSAYAGGGIVARCQDINNFWLLAVKDPSETEPVFGLYKVVGGVHTLAAGITIPSHYLPLPGYTSSIPIRLTCEGDVITGEIAPNNNGNGDAIYDASEITVQVTDSTFNTATKVGMWSNMDGMNWYNFKISYWPLGGNLPGETGREWDIFVWDTTPVSTSTSDSGWVDNYIYFYRGSNGKSAPPYHSSFIAGIDTDVVGSVVNYRVPNISDGMFLLQFEAVSGDTSAVEILEFGSYDQGFDTWVDLNTQVHIAYDGDTLGAGSVSATIRARCCLDTGEGSFNDRKPLAGTMTEWKTFTISASSTGP